MTRRRLVLVAALCAGLPAAAAARATGAPASLVVQAAPGSVAKAERALGGSGLRVQRRTGRELQVVADPVRLPGLARLPGVTGARAATPAFADEALVSEGLARSGAAVLERAADGGRGLTIAVLDMGFGRNLTPQQGAGELPPAERLELRSFDATAGIFGTNAYGNATNHGELVAQTVFDYAPEASYVLVNYHTEADFLAAADWLLVRRPDVVVHSNSFIEGPFDGTGAAARAVDRAADAGILWVNSAGNYARQHWRGPWTDPAGDRTLDWPGGDWVFEREAGLPITFALSWTPRPSGPPTDLDLTLERQDPADASWDPVASSTDAQVRGAGPSERVTGYESPVAGLFRLRVGLRSGPAPAGDLSLFSREIALAAIGGSEQSSVPTPGDAAGSLTVGAVDWRGNVLKRYSSQGPTLDGRPKPDLVASTDTRVAGPVARRAVGGTSIAAPNAAGAAAVLIAARRLSGAPSDPAGVRAELAALALDLGPTGPDPAFGAGRVRLETAPPRLVRPRPRPNAPVRARTRIGVTAVDRSPVAAWSLSLDGAPITRRRSGVTREVSLDTRRLADGFHLLRADVRDFPGNDAAYEWYVRVDNTAPVLSVTQVQVQEPPRPPAARPARPGRRARARRPPPPRPAPPRAVRVLLTGLDSGSTGRLRLTARLTDLEGRPLGRRTLRVRNASPVGVPLGKLARGRYILRLELRDPAGNIARTTRRVLVRGFAPAPPPPVPTPVPVPVPTPAPLQPRVR